MGAISVVQGGIIKAQTKAMAVAVRKKGGFERDLGIRIFKT